MAQEMSFAQALTEARQIIVQQSNRIKTDLDRIKSLQETIATQTGTIAETDRTLRQKVTELEAAQEQAKTATARAEEMRLAREQAEAVIDRQGQRLTQMQETIAGLEKQFADAQHLVDQLQSEMQSMRPQMPTHEDTEALAALASLLSAKKSGPSRSAHAEEPAAVAA